MYMISTLRTFFIVWLMIAAVPLQSEASFASDALAKARKTMQSAFQMSFLNKLPVVFYKKHFDTMFEHTNRSIDEMNLKYGDKTITRNDFQDDKAMHIKKSAELALHIQSLIGSKHLAYGITMAIGLIKEAIDGSFLNPGGSRSREDVYADHVGAKAVFGKEKFDKSLDKYMGHFVKPGAGNVVASAADSVAMEDSASRAAAHVESPFSGSPVNPEASVDSSVTRQNLLRQYYEATEKGDTASMQRIAAELKALR
jgi:hypothetical protein